MNRASEKKRYKKDARRPLAKNYKKSGFSRIMGNDAEVVVPKAYPKVKQDKRRSGTCLIGHIISIYRLTDSEFALIISDQ